MSMIKKLRDQSGAPISDVKKALEETGWDLKLASEELRKKGLSAASKKASRSACEGLVGLASSGRGVAIVEINSETDFVARNDLFTGAVSKAAQALLESASAFAPDTGAGGSTGVLNVDAETLGAIRVRGDGGGSDGAGDSVEDGEVCLADIVQGVAGTVRENVKLRRGVVLRSLNGIGSGVVGTYLHAKVDGAPGCGRIAGAVLLESDGGFSGVGGVSGVGEGADLTVVQETANKLAMHVVGSVPKYLDRESVPVEDLEKERQLLMEQAGTTGKPANIVEKMVEGRLNKFYQEHCLLEQAFVMDDKKRVKDVVKELGKHVRLEAFARVAVEGDGDE